MNYIKTIIAATLLLFASSAAAVDMYIGVGNTIHIPGDNVNDVIPVVSVMLREEETKFPMFLAATYREEYIVYGRAIQPHYTIAAGMQILQYDISDNINVYIDFGVAATSEVSIVTSSRFMFYEGAGIIIDKPFGMSSTILAGIEHTSNAGIVPPNEGETSFFIRYKIDI